MYRWLVPVAVLFLLLVSASVTGRSAYAGASDAGDSSEEECERLAAPPEGERTGRLVLDSQLEGQIVIHADGDAALRVAPLESDPEQSILPLIALAVLAAPLFAVATVGLYAIRRR